MLVKNRLRYLCFQKLKATFLSPFVWDRIFLLFHKDNIFIACVMLLVKKKERFLSEGV